MKMAGNYEDHCGDYENTVVITKMAVITKISVVITKMTGDYEIHCGDYEDGW